MRTVTTPADMRGGATMLIMIQIFLIGFCNMIAMRMTAMKVELMWTEYTPNS